MMMMLESGGMPVLTDNIRTADADNPKGYYEFERVKEIEHDKDWLEEADGKAVKMISALLQYLPADCTYCVIFMQRKMEEILASQRQMLIRRGEDPDSISDNRIARILRKHLERVHSWLEKRSNIKTIYVNYNEIISDPLEQARRLAGFVNKDLDVEQMAMVVDPSLYRQIR